MLSDVDWSDGMKRDDKRDTLGRSDLRPLLEIFRGAYGDERDAPARANAVKKYFSFLTFPNCDDVCWRRHRFAKTRYNAMI
jgi:hypothetical protein